MTKSLKGILYILFIFFFHLANGQSAEEFNGPFASWANVKTRFHAKGDGNTDDTKALQDALDSLTCRPTKFNTGPAAYTVIYIPSGTYRITRKLTLLGKIGVQIVGEHPANTIIKWDGTDDSTMLLANGSAYYKISRITWDANNRPGVECVGIHWLEKWRTENSRSFAALNIELSDLVFKGRPKYGVSGGSLRGKPGQGTGHNDSEITIRRCVFDSCIEAGVRISGYNALEYWIWDSKFLGCRIGVHSSLGNYHLYRSYFRNSGRSDIYNKNGYYTSVRFCYSENSNAFSLDEGASTNPFKRTFQGNTIINTRTIPIQYYHVGKLTLLDNRISRSRDLENPYLVNQKGGPGFSYQYLSVGNSYENEKDALRIGGKNKKIRSIEDKPMMASRSVQNDFLSKMPQTPERIDRPVFEIPLDADAETIQQIIDRAAEMKGKRPVVHFAYGDYKIDKTLVIPAGADMQIIGDGMRYSTLVISKKGVYQTFRVKGPSYISIQEIQIGTIGSKKNLAVGFQGIDQQGSAVLMDQIYSNADTTLFVNGLDHTYFEKNNSFFSDGNVIIGGELQKSGQGSLRVNCFGGQYASLEVKNNAAFLAKDCWWEGKTSVPLYFKGDGTVTIESAKIAPVKADSTPIIDVAEFNGKISLMNMYIQGGIQIAANNPSLDLLIWNAHVYFKKDIHAIIPDKFNGRLMFAGFTTQCFDKSDPDCQKIRPVGDISVRVDDENKFLNEMTAQDRFAVPIAFNQRAEGPSSIYISRVLFDNYEIALQFGQKVKSKDKER